MGEAWEVWVSGSPPPADTQAPETQQDSGGEAGMCAVSSHTHREVRGAHATASLSPEGPKPERKGASASRQSPPPLLRGHFKHPLRGPPCAGRGTENSSRSLA